MEQFGKIWDFQNLYKAHKAARLGRRDVKEVIDFELNLSENLADLSEALRTKSYRMSGYYSFMVHDPKERTIHALHYRDRVVQHCVCDEVLAPVLERKLIYDNAACRTGKGTHFAISRVSGFLHAFYRKYGTEGYFLKYDIRKFFDSIDHAVLKRRMRRYFTDPDVLWILGLIIDSYETDPGKGIPMGNQTSQWFAVSYLDGLDRLIKEQLGIRWYSRYMDDAVLIHPDRDHLKDGLRQMETYLNRDLLLQFNRKTQIFPVRQGVDYLGWHIYLTETGKVIRKVRQRTKRKFRYRLRQMETRYRNGEMGLDEIKQVLSSYRAHFSHGNVHGMHIRLLRDFVLTKGDPLEQT